jgi:hypothetical protein
MARYYGRYSSRTRGAEHEQPGKDQPVDEKDLLDKIAALG